MSTPNDNDLILIERSGIQYHLSYEDMSTLNDDDLLLVERSGTQYKIEAQYMNSGSFDTPVAVLTPLNGAGLNAGESYEPFSTAIVSESNGVITFTDETELSNIIGPVKMVDANGDVKTPVTSAATSASVIAGDTFFAATVYTGSGGVRTITNGIDLAGEGGLVWSKLTTLGFSHCLVDTERGVSKVLVSDSLDAQVSAPASVTGFNSDGYDISADTYVNLNPYDYVSWTFRKAPKFFDIQTWSGDNAIGLRALSHDLTTPPAFIIARTYNNSAHFLCWHKDLTGKDYTLFLNMTSAETPLGAQVWDATDTTFSVSSDGTGNNAEKDYIAYLFADTPGLIKCGSYTGTGAAGLAVSTGFEPQWLMIKRINAAEDWVVLDTARGWTSSSAEGLFPNSNAQESSVANIAPTPTGFITLSGGWAGVNGNGDSYIYVAIAAEAKEEDITELTLTDSTDLSFLTVGDEVVSPGLPQSFSVSTYTGNSGTQSITTGLTPDLVWIKCQTAANGHQLYDSLRGPTKVLVSNTTGNEVTEAGGLTSFNADGFSVSYDSAVNGATGGFVAWSWSAGDTTVTNNEGTIASQVRSNGDFSVVSYTGNGTNSTFGHGLDSVAAMVIIKGINSTNKWSVRHKSLTGLQNIFLNNTGQADGSIVYWQGQYPTDEVVYLGTWSGLNGSAEPYIAYCWAESPTQSFGSYDGNTTTLPVIDCGFEPSFVLVKRSSSAGGWMLVDSARGTDKYLEADEAGQEGTEQSMNFTSTGFTITTTNSSWNSSGETYIYAAFSDEGRASGEVLSVDVANKKLELNNVGDVWETGHTATGPELNTVANNVTSQTGDTLTVSGVTGNTGNWVPGLYAEGATVTRSAPSASSIVFTTSNAGTTAVTGIDATLSRRFWTLESSNSSSGPWTSVGTYTDTAANAGQDGSTPWSGHPTLQADTYYQVKVRYDSDNAQSIESTFNTFKTAP